MVIGRADDDGQQWRELARVDIPIADTEPRTTVESIDPGVETVPANLLRFSVTFSAVMEEGSAAGQLRVLDESETELPGTLLEMPPELWDRERRRLTVLVEPGRIKRGLQPNVQAGAPLREGSVITLDIGPAIRDALGSPLVSGAQRTYLVGPPMRSRVDPSLWQVQWPEVPMGSLVIRFDRPLDRALVLRWFRALDRHGRPVPGRAVLDRMEWSFTPAEPGDWKLHIDTRVEDLAGNSIRRIFDRDLSQAGDDGIAESEIILTREAI